MNNVIVLGDSYCSTIEGWPQTLSKLIGRNLVCFTQGAGQSWWTARNWLLELDQSIIDQCDVMVFAHTNADRIPTSNTIIGHINHCAPAATEQEKSIQLYYKYIHDPLFLRWAQQQWFKEISTMYGQKYLVHLHCFPWTLGDRHLLSGLNLTTNLTALSLNELGAKEFGLYNDHRPNHFSEHNNAVLAMQLADLIQCQATGDNQLDHTKFQQKTLDWLTKKHW